LDESATMNQFAQSTEFLHSSLGEDPDLREIVEMFVEEMPDRIAGLLEQAEARNWDGLRRVAHQLKGAAGSYGFDTITPCAGRLEDAIRNGDAEAEILRLVEGVVDLCRRARV
jgi:histidine phosphotransfer protein HptB